MTRAPDTVAGVVARLNEIQRDVSPGDGVGVFNAMYRRVTEQVAAGLEARTTFQDPEFMHELDVRFAGRWIAAYDASVAGGNAPSAWAPLFEERVTRGIFAIQYALAGMNAHIEYDLPLAVVDTCRSRGVTPGQGSVHRDYEAVNDLLAEVESEIRRSFLTEIGQRVDEEVGPLVHLVSAWNIDKARDLAWVNVETLWATGPLDFLSARYVAMLGHTVGMASRCLLTPVGRRLLPGAGTSH